MKSALSPLALVNPFLAIQFQQMKRGEIASTMIANQNIISMDGDINLVAPSYWIESM